VAVDLRDDVIQRGVGQDENLRLGNPPSGHAIRLRDDRARSPACSTRQPGSGRIRSMSKPDGAMAADIQGLMPRVSTGADVTLEELQLAGRNHSMPLEALRYDIPPVGMHYLLIHWDIPYVDADSWRLTLGGTVR